MWGCRGLGASFLIFISCLIFISSLLIPSVRPIHRRMHQHMATTWVDNQGNDVNAADTNENELRIISYNILGPLHGESSKHFYAPTSITKWTRRRDKVLSEIKSTHADIVCLQEVSYKSLKETFIPGLKSVGLKLSSYAASKFSQTNKFSHGHKQIGCAIFVRENKLQMVATRSVHLREFATVDHCSSSGFKLDVKGKHNCIAMACLQLTRTNRTFVVANTHLFWDPGRADIKTIQTAAAVRAISAFINRTLAQLKLNATSVLPPIATDMSDNNSVSDNTELDDNSDDDDGVSDVGYEIDEEEGDNHSDKTATITITAAETEVNNNRNSDSNGSSMGGNNIPRSSETVNESIPLAISDQQLPSNNIPIILCGDFNTFLEVESVDADSGFIPSSISWLHTTSSCPF